MKGKKILITRAENQANEFREIVERAGAIPIVFPMIRFESIENNASFFQIFDRLDEIDWIVFTSATTVEFFFQEAEKREVKFYFFPDLKIATVGEKTKLKLEQLGYRTNFVPIKYTASVLAENMDDVKGKNILIPRSNLASNNYVSVFEKRGATVFPITVYKNLAVEYSKEEISTIFQEPFDYLTFASGSAFEAFHNNLQKNNVRLSGEKIVCIGPSTAGIAKKLGYEVVGIAEEHTVEGIVKIITKLENNA